MDAVTARRQVGFTLLEILLVVLVIGMGLAIAVPRLMPDKKADAQRAAQAIVAALERARDEAVFSGTAVAVQFSASNLQYQERDARNTAAWTASNRAGLADMKLPDNLVAIEISDAASAINALPTTALPRLVFQPAGFGAPATITLKFSESAHRIVLSPIGAVTLDPALTVANNVR